MAVITGRIRGRAFGHWTPRYVRARAYEMLYQRRNPDDPWLTPEAVRLLDSMLRPTDVGAEFGSGRSTSWLAKRCAHLTSVEHDEAWFAKVSATLAAGRITHVDYRYQPVDKPDEPGDLSGYAQVAQFLGDESIDFALVDGLYRDYVTLFLLGKIRPGGMIIIDDVHRYLPSLSMAPLALRPPAGPVTAEWEQAAAVLAGWRHIWTSNGVSDTAIFVKALDAGGMSPGGCRPAGRAPVSTSGREFVRVLCPGLLVNSQQRVRSEMARTRIEDRRWPPILMHPIIPSCHRSGSSSWPTCVAPPHGAGSTQSGRPEW
jgi:predicted O-methyltransferase YrrM